MRAGNEDRESSDALYRVGDVVRGRLAACGRCGDIHNAERQLAGRLAACGRCGDIHNAERQRGRRAIQSTALSAGGTYLANGFQFVEPATHFDQYFAFTTTSPLNVTITASVLEANPVANGPFGIAGFTVEWLASGASTTFTD